MLKICCISDTHSMHRQVNIPECDVLIHAGDITWKGEIDILHDFCEWMQELPMQHKVIIFGNHELGFEAGPKRETAIRLVKQAGIHYLEDSGVKIEGVEFWGSPVTPEFFSWEWNRKRGSEIQRHWDMIPTSTQVLITHGPPMGILDEVPRGFGMTEHVGCQDLLNRIQQLPDLKLHAVGHIHAGAGSVKIGQTTFVNASTCTEAYKPTNPPIIVEI